MLYRNDVYPGTLDANQLASPTGTQVGLGTRVQSTQKDFRQGAIQDTGRELDLAIEGNGFLQVLDPLTQTTMYTRSGNLDINADGNLVIGSAQTGRPLEPPITIPPNTSAVQIISGQVLTRQPGEQQFTQIGRSCNWRSSSIQTVWQKWARIYISKPMRAALLFLLIQVQMDSVPCDSGPWKTSNVEPVQELIDLITTQRGFELNSQAVQAGDQLMQLISNLRR